MTFVYGSEYIVVYVCDSLEAVCLVQMRSHMGCSRHFFLSSVAL